VIRTRGSLARPAWARALLALTPLGDRRTEVSSDLGELFLDRRGRYGVAYAHGRLFVDVVSLWRGRARGGLGGLGGSMRQNLRFALRLCRRNPAPVAVALGGLALAIGTVTAAFSIVNATMLRPYGMDDPASVVRVASLDHGDRPFPYWPYAQYVRMRAGTSGAVIEAASLERQPLGIAGPDDAAPSQWVLFVSGSYLDTLGGRPVFGRPLTPADDAPDAPPALVVSHHLWKTLLASDPSVVGRTVWLTGVPMTLVGVLEPGFSGPESPRPGVWVPMTLYDEVRGGTPVTPTSGPLVEVVARLEPDASRRAVEDNLTALVNAPSGDAPARADERRRVVGLVGAASPMDDADAEDYIVLACVFAILGLVLALGCANTANLLLAGATTRMREIGVRLALGATGRRLLAQLGSESLLLGLAAGAAGYVVAIWLSPVFASAIDVQPEVNVSPDVRVLLFAVAVAFVCGIGAGLSPARYAARSSVLTVLRSQARTPDGPPVSTRRRTWFVGFQAATSMLLLAMAALLTRSAVLAASTDAGLDVDRLINVHLQMPRTDFDEPAYLQRALDAVRALPAVEGVALSQHPPFGSSVNTLQLPPDLDGRYELYQHRTDADYFAVSGTSVIRGRSFTAAEVSAEAPVALVSADIARRFFGEADPLGQPISRIPTRNPQPHAVIVGVVEDAITNSFHAKGAGTLYRPLARERSNPPGLVVRTANPGVAAHAVGEALRRLDSRVRPSTTVVRERFDAFLNWKRMMAWLMGPIAVLALALSTLGIFGLTAFVVGQRSHEVSVRMAVGASAGDVLRLLAADSLRPVVIGLGVGLLAALGVGRVLPSLFSGISPHDPAAIGLAMSALLAGALVAVLVPVSRMAATDPASVLRDV
jgi:putative ABC transport system permease protein